MIIMFREKPGDTEWTELLELKIPLLMNLAQCRLKANDYYEAITHTTEVIEHRPEHVKVILFGMIQINIYFRLRFGLFNSIDTNLR